MYYGDCGCSKGEIITFVIPKTANIHYLMQLFVLWIVNE